ncbi:hemolysin [Staphylococcus phage PG-2021_40]
METNQIKDLLYRIRKLEEVIQNNDYVKQEKYDILSKELDGIEKQLTELDKTYAVDKVRNKQLFETVNSLSQELENFKKSIKDDNNSKKEMGEKILLILLGSIVTFIMGRFS